jgi:pimeloyl-ACP methyl ester carboxylesterase
MLVCLVHGAWHDEASWQPLVAELERRGHECVVPVLPLDDDRAGFDDYAEVVDDGLGDRELPVLVGHSMSSAVIPLLAVKRPVRLLVYLCPAMGGFAPLPGEPPWRRAGYDSPPVDASGRSWWPRERAIDQLYRRVNPELAERLADRLRPQPQSVFDGPYPLARPPDVPSSFIYAREDELFDERWSRWIASNLLGVEPIELPGGHFPMLEHPALLADALETVSGERGGRNRRSSRDRDTARIAAVPDCPVLPTAKRRSTASTS